MWDLIARHRITPELVTTLTEEPARRIFGRGSALYLRNWPYAWRLFAQEGSPVKDKVGVKALPHFKGQRSAASSIERSAWVITSLPNCIARWWSRLDDDQVLKFASQAA